MLQINGATALGDPRRVAPGKWCGGDDGPSYKLCCKWQMSSVVGGGMCDQAGIWNGHGIGTVSKRTRTTNPPRSFVLNKTARTNPRPSLLLLCYPRLPQIPRSAAPRRSSAAPRTRPRTAAADDPIWWRRRPIPGAGCGDLRQRRARPRLPQHSLAGLPPLLRQRRARSPQPAGEGTIDADLHAQGEAAGAVVQGQDQPCGQSSNPFASWPPCPPPSTTPAVAISALATSSASPAKSNLRTKVDFYDFSSLVVLA